MEQTISYDKTLYSPLVIQRAIEAYERIVDVKVIREDDSYIEVWFGERENLGQVVGEFNNFLIQLENQNG